MLIMCHLVLFNKNQRIALVVLMIYLHNRRENCAFSISKEKELQRNSSLMLLFNNCERKVRISIKQHLIKYKYKA